MTISSKLKLTPSDFIPGNLDFSSLGAEEFEKLVFHLLDEMGFSNLVWRKGGPGNSSTDGGRDLEGSFWQKTPHGTREENYWFEVKFRSNRLEKNQIQSTVINSAISTDNLVIITNSTISNPTVDWIAEFQKSHRRPIVEVWQGHDLELYLKRCPKTLAEFLPKALSFSGKCKAIESSFLNEGILPSCSELDLLWEHRDEIRTNHLLAFIVCTAEVAFGEICHHPWGMFIVGDDLYYTFVSGMAVIPHSLQVFIAHNRDNRPIVQSLSYLAQCFLMRNSAEFVVQILLSPESCYEDTESPTPELAMFRAEPIVFDIIEENKQHCCAFSCSKVRAKSRDDDYYRRFTGGDQATEEEQCWYLISENSECELGLSGPGQPCPLFLIGSKEDMTYDNLIASLEAVKRIIQQRRLVCGRK